MNNEEKILAILTQMQTDISDLKAGQAKLEAAQAKMQEDIDEIKTNVEYIWEDISRTSDRVDKHETIIRKKSM